MSRKAHGASFATAVGARIASFRYERGADQAFRYESSRQSARSLCARCESTVPSEGERISLPAVLAAPRRRNPLPT
jgi:hypothetical protein